MCCAIKLLFLVLILYRGSIGVDQKCRLYFVGCPAPVIFPAYAWSGHEKYTNIIKSRIRNLGKRWGRGMDDMQLILEIKDIQSFAKSGLEIGDLN